MIEESLFAFTYMETIDGELNCPRNTRRDLWGEQRSIRSKSHQNSTTDKDYPVVCATPPGGIGSEKRGASLQTRIRYKN